MIDPDQPGGMWLTGSPRIDQAIGPSKLFSCDRCNRYHLTELGKANCCKPSIYPDMPTQADLGKVLKQTNAQKYPKYFRDVSDIDSIDVYGVCQLFGVSDASGALHHAIKKLLLSGVRTGGKSARKDIEEARDTLNRYLDLIK